MYVVFSCWIETHCFCAHLQAHTELSPQCQMYMPFGESNCCLCLWPSFLKQRKIFWRKMVVTLILSVYCNCPHSHALKDVIWICPPTQTRWFVWENAASSSREMLLDSWQDVFFSPFGNHARWNDTITQVDWLEWSDFFLWICLLPIALQWSAYLGTFTLVCDVSLCEHLCFENKPFHHNQRAED